MSLSFVVEQHQQKIERVGSAFEKASSSGRKLEENDKSPCYGDVAQDSTTRDNLLFNLLLIELVS